MPPRNSSALRLPRATTGEPAAAAGGYIKVSRQAFRGVEAGGCPFWNEKRVLSRWEAWMFLQQSAAWAPYWFSVPNGDPIGLAIGETRPLSIRFLISAWGWGSKKRVEKFLALLAERGQLRKGKGTSYGDTYIITASDVTHDPGYTNGDNSGYSVGYTPGYSAGDSNGYSPGYKREEEKEDIEEKEEEECTRRPSRLEKDTSDFDMAWSLYPRRAGGNSRVAALRAWNKRRKEGVSASDMIEGVRRYAAFIRAEGDEGSNYVKQAASFFGPDEHWAERWEVGPETKSTTDDPWADVNRFIENEVVDV